MTYIDTETDTIVKDHWTQLQGPVRNSVLDQEYKAAVRNALSGHVLDEEAVAALEEEVLMVLLGLQSKEDFVTYIPAIQGLTENDATSIAAHLNKHYFSLLSPFIGTNKVASATTVGSTSPFEQFVNKEEDVRVRFKKLPESVRATILSDDVAHAFSEVVRTHDLSQEQFVTLGDAVVRVMVGLATTKDFREQVETKKLADKEHAQSLITVVEQTLFKPARDAVVAAVAALEKQKKAQ